MITSTLNVVVIVVCEQMQSSANIEHFDLLDNPDYEAFDFEFENLEFWGRNGSHLNMTACYRFETSLHIS